MYFNVLQHLTFNSFALWPGDVRGASVLFANDVVLLASSHCDLQRAPVQFAVKHKCCQICGCSLLMKMTATHPQLPSLQVKELKYLRLLRSTGRLISISSRSCTVPVNIYFSPDYGHEPWVSTKIMTLRTEAACFFTLILKKLP